MDSRAADSDCPTLLTWAVQPSSMGSRGLPRGQSRGDFLLTRGQSRRVNGQSGPSVATDAGGSPTARVGSSTARLGSRTARVGSRTARVGRPTARVGSPTDRVGSPTDRVGSPTDRWAARLSPRQSEPPRAAVALTHGSRPTAPVGSPTDRWAVGACQAGSRAAQDGQSGRRGWTVGPSVELAVTTLKNWNLSILGAILPKLGRIFAAGRLICYFPTSLPRRGPPRVRASPCIRENRPLTGGRFLVLALAQ